MIKLVETLKIDKGMLCNISYHNDRMNRARKLLFNLEDQIDLKDIIKIPEGRLGLIKCRVIYDRIVHEIQFQDYVKKIIRSFKLVYNDDIDYSCKYLDRTPLNKLKELREECDDIIIVKNGLLTDTSSANIAIFDGTRWLTPRMPLLAGTKRRELLETGRIFEADIQVDDLDRMVKVKPINCMLDFDDNDYIDVKNIVI